MSVHETAKGWQVDRRDAYNRRVRLTFAGEGAARATDARLDQEADQQRSALRSFRKAADLNLGEAVNEYLAARVVSESTRRRETQALNTLVRGLGNKPLASITPRAVAEYMERRKEILAPWTLYRESLWLHALFQWFTAQWFIPANPVTSNPKPTAPRQSRARALSYGETAELVSNTNVRLRLRVLLALDAGCSSLEAHNLRRRHVDFEARAIDVHPVKQHAFRRVPMTPRLESELAQLLAGVTSPDAPIISRASRPIGEKARSHLSHMLRMRVSFEMRYHDLRHTFATRLAAVAQRPRIVQYLLGHHPTTPTEKYDHPTEEDARAAIQAMQQRESEQITRPQGEQIP